MAKDRDLPDIVERAHRNWNDSRDHSSSWRAEAQECYDMVAGRQWTTADEAAMQDQSRVPTVFNRIARTINTIIGTQIANRQQTRFIPREMGDAKVNEILTAAAEWVRDQCDAEDEESDAFADMAISGMGWTETRLDYEADSDGKVLVERVDPLEMYWDPAATKRNLSDARWVMRVKRIRLEEFEREWPGANLDLVGAPWETAADSVTTHTWVPPQDAYKDDKAMGGGPKGRRMVRVAQLQWAEKNPSYRVGKKAESVDAAQFDILKDKLDETATPYVKQPKVRWRQAFVAGAELLDEGDCPFTDGPTFRCLTFARDRNRNLWFGLVLAMKDPQRFGNKFFSQILDILNKGAKGGVMVEADATDDIRDLEAKWARPDAVHKFRPGALSGGKVQLKTAVQWPAGLDRLMTFSLDAVHEVTGVNLELLGFAGINQPGILEQHRKQAGLTILAPLFDAMRRYRKEQGRVLLYFIQTYLSDGRLIRVMGQNGNEQYVPLAKQPEAAKYDVIVDEMPTSPNMKERVFGSLVQMLPTLGKMGVPIPPEVLDFAPIPSGLAQKWKEMLVASGGNPEQARAQMEQMGQQMQRLVAENRALKNRREETAAELQMNGQKQQAEAQMAGQKLQAEMQMKARAQEQAMQLAFAEHQAKLAQMEREYELRTAEARHKMQLAEIELQADVAIQAKRAEVQAGARPTAQ